MKRILHLISSFRGHESYSIQLGQAIIEKIVRKYPGSIVSEINLVELNLPHLDLEAFQSFFASGLPLTSAQQETVDYSDKAVNQLMEADILVIGAPLYNFTVPTQLKAWLDYVTRPGITFGYTENGPVGKVVGKKVYVAMSSGGIYSEGPGKSNDFVAPFLKAFLGLLGMTDLTVFRAEGVKVPGVMEHALQKGIDSIQID